MISQGITKTFDKCTIIELSRDVDVIKEIAQKYENMQKGVGGIMGGALIETEARRLRDEAKREVVINMLKRGKMTIEEIAEDTKLSVTEVEQIVKLQTV